MKEGCFQQSLECFPIKYISWFQLKCFWDVGSEQLEPEQLSSVEALSPVLTRRSSTLISYLSQCSVHCLYEAIQVSCLECLVSSETAILEDRHYVRCDQRKAKFWHFFHSPITPIIFHFLTSIPFVLPSPVTPTSDSYFLIEYNILPAIINTSPNSQHTSSFGIKKHFHQEPSSYLSNHFFSSFHRHRCWSITVRNILPSLHTGRGMVLIRNCTECEGSHLCRLFHFPLSFTPLLHTPGCVCSRVTGDAVLPHLLDSPAGWGTWKGPADIEKGQEW